MPQKRLVFHLTQGPGRQSTATTLYLNANDPGIVLDEAQIIERTAVQQQAIPAQAKLKLTTQDVDLFEEQDISWAYRRYIVQRLEPTTVATARPAAGGKVREQLGDRPPRPKNVGNQAASIFTESRGILDELPKIESETAAINTVLPPSARPGAAAGGLLTADAPASAPEVVDPLYLFNIIVALEWLPGEAYLRQLEWAFQRASDFLYDVTNGCMAFGQVVIGGPELLDCADIQIMASNRLLPRSWVGGLLMNDKRMPIRLGRGIWVRRRQGIISWDEPEGYRSLVHEWCHYALALKDEYIAVRDVARRDPATDQPISGQNRLVLPRARVTSTSIMATAEGNSELRDLSKIEGKYGDTLKAILKKAYPGLIERLRERSSGPGQLPLPFPVIRRAGELIAVAKPQEQSVKLSFVSRTAPAAPPAADDPPVIPRDEELVPDEGWEMYLVRGGLEQPERVIAQGQVDASPTEDGFPVYGGYPERDQILLVGRSGHAARLWVSPLAEHPTWNPLTLSEQPFAVLPGQPNTGTPPTTDVTLEGSDFQAPEARLFPLKDTNGVVLTPEKPEPLTTLDGILFVKRGDQITIGCYSQGGGPTSAPNVIFDPVAAGSSNGDALLFFFEDEPGKYPKTDQIRVVTMALHSLRGTIPLNYQPLSHVYAIASNQALNTELLPTLTIACRQADLGAGEQLYIGRLDGDEWTILPSHTPPGITMAAISLSDSGEKLIKPEVGDAKRVEYFRLFAKQPGYRRARTS